MSDMKHMKMEQRERVLREVLGGHLSTAQAAMLMGVSARHARRLVEAYREGGAPALVHGNRGRKSPNAVPEATAARVVALAGGKYRGLNHSQITDLLAEREGIHLSHQTVNRLLNRAGLVSIRQHSHHMPRIRRERMPQEGLLLQIGRSRRKWLEDRGEPMVLLLAVDDATNTVVNGVFRLEEDTLGYFLLLEGVIGGPGIPGAIYIDRHGGFESNCPPPRIHRPDEFARGIGELGIQRVNNRSHGNSPPFEGRVSPMVDEIRGELIGKLRQARARTIGQANAVLRDFLPDLDETRRVLAQQPQIAYRQLDASLSLEQILCIKTPRTVTGDNTVDYQRRTLQLPLDQKWPRYAGLRVEVLEHTDGRLTVQYGGEVIPHQEAPPSPGALPTPQESSLAPTP